MNNNHKYAIISLLLALFCSFFIAYGKDNNLIPTYEITGAGTGSEGTYLIDVTVISKKNNPDDNIMKRAAVHGVLFKGFSNKALRQMQKPLAGSAANEAQHIDFYNDFFSEAGSALNYASIVNGSRKVIKSGKEYRVTVTVSVNKEELHSYLESLGILNGLNSGF